MFKGLKSIFKKEAPCTHRNNYTSRQYVDKDTPMYYFHCHDCGFVDRGHVYGDTEDWEKTIVCLNSEIVNTE